MSNHIENYMTVSAILGPRPERVNYWVTTKEWSEVVVEVEALGQKIPKARRGLNDYMHVRANLRVLNAGTDDQRFVNAMNTQECPVDFAWRRDNLRTG